MSDISLESIRELHFSFPYKGMASDISLDDLPEGYASWISNMYVTTNGMGSVRYGCRLMGKIPVSFSEKYYLGYKIMKMWPSMKDGQIIIYAKALKKDNGADSISVVDPNTLKVKGIKKSFI